MNGRCSIQFVVEGDGSVYPCDFYVTDEWKLGNVADDSFASMLTGPKAHQFIRDSMVLPEECRICPILRLCRNGCRRDRMDLSGKTCFCDAHRRFFTERRDQILDARNRILWMRRNAQQQK